MDEIFYEIIIFSPVDETTEKYFNLSESQSMYFKISREAIGKL